MNTVQSRLEFRRQLQAGLDHIFGVGMQYDMEKDRYILDESDKRKMLAYGLDITNDEQVREFAKHESIRFRMKENYTFGWDNPADLLNGWPYAEPVEEDLPYARPPKITWWTRVVWRLWRWAKKRLQ